MYYAFYNPSTGELVDIGLDPDKRPPDTTYLEIGEAEPNPADWDPYSRIFVGYPYPAPPPEPPAPPQW